MAGRIRAEDILAVKERTSIEEVVREHVTLTRRGSALVGLCPFHDEKTGSFNVNPHNGFYHCYGCGVGGDVIKFVSDIEHLTFTEAVERLAGKVGVELRYEDGGGRREEAGGAGRRPHYGRARAIGDDEAMPLTVQQSGDLCSIAGADLLLPIPAGVAELPAGAEVWALVLDPNPAEQPPAS